jgi:RNA polymerase sigma factor (sigma-70 family)
MGTLDTSLGGSRRDFSATVLEMVRRASDASTGVRQEALDDLCRRYWKPVYHYFRAGWVKSNEDAKDLTQAFFLSLMDGETLSRYDPQRASFRTFLKSLLRHFVQNHDEALARLKRGGGLKILKLDDPDVPLNGTLPDPREANPDDAFHHEWRSVLLSRAVERVRQRLLSEGKEIKFRVFEAYDLCPGAEPPTYASLGKRFGLEGSIVQHYLVDVREELRNEIRRELAETASSPEDLEEEWNAFFRG